MRSESYIIEVPGVGPFEVRRPVMRTAISIEIEYARLTEGVEKLPEELVYLCRIVAFLKVMVLSGPNGWDVENLNPYSDAETTRLREVFDAITAEEARFREGAKPNAETTGAGTQ